MTPDFSVCVCTCRRPEMLDRLLGELATHDYGGLQGEFVIVDNDPAGSGLAVIEGWRDRLPFALTVRHVTEQNIARARNAGVAAARGEWLLILDDDEWPAPDWARALFQAQRQHAADAVFGPVIPHYAHDVPSWIAQADYFAARQFAEGAPLRGTQTYTSNVLIRRQALSGIAGPFDPAFGLTGGSDAMLFQDMAERGAVLVWTQTARVHETVPRARANVPWLLRRAYSGGQIYVRVQTGTLPPDARRAAAWSLGLRALAQFPIAVVIGLACLPLSRGNAVRWWRKASAQLGKLTGLLGARYGAYDPHVKRRAN